MSIINEYVSDDFAIYNSDCVHFAKNMPDNSVDFCVYSPPFSSLYVYSESAADMGNVDSDDEFIEQYRYLVREKFRILRAGRLTAIHVKDLVYYQGSSDDGTAGLRPFSDMCTKVHQEEGFTFVCRITIYRDPVLERSKTNAHGLLYKTFRNDASFCRVGMPEYLMVYRKWATPETENHVKPVIHVGESEKNAKEDSMLAKLYAKLTGVKDVKTTPLEMWQSLASPVWRARSNGDYELHNGTEVWNLKESGQGDGDMPATDVLNVKQARNPDAEKHLCPMPLNITQRAIKLWTNEGDTVFSPFAGIGSEGVAALRMRRKFIGTELNPSYYESAINNLSDSNITGMTADFLG